MIRCRRGATGRNLSKRGQIMSDLTKDDWAEIHAKAWADQNFRTLLETDPTAAVRSWAEENHRVVDKIVVLSEWVQKDDIDSWNHGPPSCC